MLELCRDLAKSLQIRHHRENTVLFLLGGLDYQIRVPFQHELMTEKVEFILKIQSVRLTKIIHYHYVSILFLPAEENPCEEG